MESIIVLERNVPLSNKTKIVQAYINLVEANYYTGKYDNQSWDLVRAIHNGNTFGTVKNLIKVSSLRYQARTNVENRAIHRKIIEKKFKELVNYDRQNKA